MAFEGIMTALTTPITEGNEIDEKCLEGLIENQISNGVHNLLILGGTGEYTSLNYEQKRQVIDISIKKSQKRIPVIVGIIDPGIGDTLDIGLYAKQAGADALMIVTPYYVGPTQEGIIEYYKTLDDKLDIPILLYNIPHKTGVNMLPETVNTIVKQTKNIVGIKECTENFGQMVELINSVGDKITVLAGEEFAAVGSMIFGAKGAVMASANIIPDTWVKIFKLINNKDIEEAIQLNKEYYPIFKSIFMEGNPGPLKSMLEIQNLSTNIVNLPLMEASEKTKTILSKLNL